MTFRNETAAASTSATKRNRVRMAIAGGAAVAVLPLAGLVTAGSASAASTSTWDAVAQCESTGNWSINSGNGFSGGLQFTQSTWAAYGGTAYANSAYQATKGQQIAIAEKVLASQGPGAWPVCSVKAGLTKGGAAAQVDTSSTKSSTITTSAKSTAAPKATAAPKVTAAPKTTTTSSTTKTVTAKTVAPKAATAPKAAKAPAAPKSNGGSYTVKSGDTLSSIAASKGLDWKTLYSHNTGVVGGNPNLILPGQVLAV